MRKLKKRKNDEEGVSAAGSKPITAGAPGSAEATCSRTRLTTIHGHSSKGNERKRLKSWIADCSKAAPTTLPTKEWVQRGSTKLVEAAHSESFTFLNCQLARGPTAEATTRVSLLQGAKETCRSSKPLERPVREKPGCKTVRSAKRTKLSVRELLNPKGSKLV